MINKQKRKYYLYLNKTRIIFFDLEFYVKQKNRDYLSFSYNPWDKNCTFLGGSFLIMNPAKDFNNSDEYIRNKIKSLWIWNYKNSERNLLLAIFKILKKEQDFVLKAHANSISPILCGIGITHADIPVLMNLFVRFKILTNKESFIFQNKFRTVDLSLLALSSFNFKHYFLYPISKNQILSKFKQEEKFESGTIVWDLYDKKNFKEIQNRTENEVFKTYLCYKLIKKNINYLRELEKIDKKRGKKQ